MRHIRVYFDFTCPFCYHEWANLRLLQRQGHDLDLEWYGWEIHPERQGKPTEPFVFDQERKNTFAELGKEAGVTAGNLSIQSASHDALRLLELAIEQGCADAWVDQVFRAVYEKGLDMSDTEHLRSWAASVGLTDAGAVLAGDQYRDVLLAHDQHCMTLPLEYVPTLEENGHIIATGVLTYEHTRDVLTK